MQIAAAVAGMLAAVVALFLREGSAAETLSLTNLVLVHVTGGIPAALRALEALWREHALLMTATRTGSCSFSLARFAERRPRVRRLVLHSAASLPRHAHRRTIQRRT